MDVEVQKNQKVGSDLHFKCVNVDYSLLLLPPEGVRLYGVFGFQVIFGVVEVNGYCYNGKKFSGKNFVCVSVPVYHVPLYVNSGRMSSPESDVDSLTFLTSRLRDLVDQPAQVASQILQYAGDCAGVLVLKHTMDLTSSFISQQHLEGIFRAPLKSRFTMLGDKCFCLRNINQPTDFPFSEQRHIYLREESYWVHGLLVRIFQHVKNLTNDWGRILLVGNKSVGKSTLIRYLINCVLSKSENGPKKVFLLDGDVGQSELTPPGLISLHEISQPFFSAPYAIQRSTFSNSFFFGSNSPAVDFGLYMDLIDRCLKRYKTMMDADSILFINTVGWIEDLGHDLMSQLIKGLEPTLIANICAEGGINYEVPYDYNSTTSRFFRERNNMSLLQSNKRQPALLRSFLTAGYFAPCFSARSITSSGSRDELRLADVRPYQVQFRSVGLYFHPELAPVVDRLIFAALNCAVVALCSMGENKKKDTDNKFFETYRINGDPFMPERLILKSKNNSQNSHEPSMIKRLDDRIFNNDRFTELPVLRCHGYGMVRAIDVERRLFYVITPVDPSVLGSVNVFALGHELQTPQILFDLRSAENAPYLVELGRTFSRNHQKLFSPLRNVSGVKRMLQRGANGATRRLATRSPRRFAARSPAHRTKSREIKKKKNLN